MADDTARIAKVIDQMRADGASHEQILEFVNMAKTRRNGQRADTLSGGGKPYWASDDPAANDYADKPEAYTPPMSRGNHSMKPWEERAMNTGMAGLAAGVAIPALLGAAPAAGLIGRAAASGVGRLATSALAGAGGAEAESATSDIQEGKPAREVLENAAEAGKTGAIFGGVTHLGGEVAGGIAGLLRKGKGLVPRYLRAKDAGVYETPEMANLPHGAEGIQKSAEKAHGRVVAKDAALDQEAGQAYQSALSPPGPRPAPRPAISSEAAALDGLPARDDQNALFAAARNVDAPPLTPPTAREQLLAATRKVDAPIMGERPAPGGYEPKPNMEAQEAWPAEGLGRSTDRQQILATLERERVKNVNPDTGRPISPAIEARYQQAVADLGPEGTVNTVGGTLGLRRGLRDEASFGNPAPSPEQAAARKVYGGYRQAVRDAAPDVAAADDAYTAHARQASRRRDILYRSESPVTTSPGGPAPDAEFADGAQGAAADLASEPGMRVAKEQAGTTMLMREGDTNVPGLKAQQFLDELKAQDPEFADALKFIGDKKALEGTRFGEPALASHLGEATAHVLGLPVRHLRQNARFAATELLDPALQAGAKLKLAAPFSGAATNPLFEAAQARRKRQSRDGGP